MLKNYARRAIADRGNSVGGKSGLQKARYWLTARR